MVLEATVICVDASEFARDGDFHPTRLQAQLDASNLISGAKSQQHPESSVGVISMASSSVDVILTPTQDIGNILSAIASIKVKGGTDCDLIKAIQIAQLALKHRQNKNQKLRIVCFVCSPISANEKQLESIGKVLKKNAVCLDIINVADSADNASKLKKLVESADSGSTSHYLEVSAASGKHLSDLLISSPIVTPEGEAPASGSFEFGVDPSMDPELAMALRMSMEEERNRLAREGGEQPVIAPNPIVTDDMDEELRAALLASMQDNAPAPEEEMEMDETDQELRQALQESVAGWKDQAQDTGNVFQDPAFVDELLRSLPGVDRNDPRIQEALRLAAQQQEKSPKSPEPKK